MAISATTFETDPLVAAGSSSAGERTDLLARVCSTTEGWEALLRTFAEDPRRSTENAAAIAEARLRCGYRSCAELRTAEEWAALGGRLARGVSSAQAIPMVRRLSPMEMSRSGASSPYQHDLVYPAECVRGLPRDRPHGFVPQFVLDADDVGQVFGLGTAGGRAFDDPVECRRQEFFRAVQDVDVESLTDVESYIMWLRYGGAGFDMPPAPEGLEGAALDRRLRQSARRVAMACSRIDENLRSMQRHPAPGRRQEMGSRDRPEALGGRPHPPRPARPSAASPAQPALDPDHVPTPAEAAQATAAILSGGASRTGSLLQGRPGGGGTQ